MYPKIFQWRNKNSMKKWMIYNMRDVHVIYHSLHICHLTFTAYRNDDIEYFPSSFYEHIGNNHKNFILEG